MIDPVAFYVFGLPIRWYSLAYLAAFLLGWFATRYYMRKDKTLLTPKLTDDLLVYVCVGVILGARLGYALFYQPVYFMKNPLDVFKVWEGGMSFHGGMIGMILSVLLFSKVKKKSFLKIMDVMGCIAPLGLFMGRIANFINGELYGRITTSPVGIIFEKGGNFPRHPSQLYEAFAEGIVLGAILNLLWFNVPYIRKRPGFTSGLFLVFYGTFRLLLENFREPDHHLGYFFGHVTMGQMLCAPMILLGLYVIYRSIKKEKEAAAAKKK